jgi:hypothetical protein
LTTATVPQTSLAVSSTYYARVKYATTNVTAATSSFSAWSSFGTASSFVPTPGSALNGGFFGGQINDGGIIYNLIVGPVATAQNGGATPTGLQYKTTNSADAVVPYQNEVYGFPANQVDFTSTYPAFQFARGLTVGGYNDWYIPAKNELEILYYNLKPDTTPNNTSSGINPNAVPARASNYTAGNPAQTTSALFQTSGAQAFSTAVSYNSSTENSGNTVQAWAQPFGNGIQAAGNKNGNRYARAIRREYANAPVAIGASFGGGFFAGQYVDGGTTYNLIVAPRATGQNGGNTPTGIQWKTTTAADTNPNSQNTVYGKLASDQFNDASHPAFQWSRGLTIATFSDWYIPAQNELAILVYNLGPSWTTATAFQTGNSEAFESTLSSYWSSTQDSAFTTDVWGQFFGNGSGGYSTKTTTTFWARAVRRVAA